MNDILKMLMELAGINWQAEKWVSLIGAVKASSLDESVKTEIIGVAQKAMDAETKRNAAVAALLEKYGTAENIDAEDPDDDDDFF